MSFTDGFELQVWLSSAMRYLQSHGAGLLDASKLSDDETVQTASYMNQHGMLAVPLRLRSATVSNCFVLVANEQAAINETIRLMQHSVNGYAKTTEAELILLQPH